MAIAKRLLRRSVYLNPHFSSIIDSSIGWAVSFGALGPGFDPRLEFFQKFERFLFISREIVDGCISLSVRCLKASQKNTQSESKPHGVLIPRFWELTVHHRAKSKVRPVITRHGEGRQSNRKYILLHFWSISHFNALLRREYMSPNFWGFSHSNVLVENMYCRTIEVSQIFML